MTLHYIKIAFRNMWKYKSQTLISMFGLAVGFTCFALATLWIVYEMTFDTFHKNAKQLYVIYKPNVFADNRYSRSASYRMASYLKETFPEIVNAITLGPSFYDNNATVEGEEITALTIKADTSIFSIFDLKVVEGSREFLIPGSNKLAITHEKARQLFGDEHPIGKTVNYRNGEYTICAVVSDMSKRSNYAFDLIQPFSEREASEQNLGAWNTHTIIELLPGTNIKVFEKKLYEHNFSTSSVRGERYFNKLTMRPLTKLRYIDPDIIREIKFQHIVIFAVSGILVIVCSLFNYLTLFVSRLRMRQKELALRVVCGASGSSLLAMLSVEFILTLLFAVLLGGAFTQRLHKPFITLSEIQMSLPVIYRESLVYIGSVILFSVLVFWLILFFFWRRSLNVSIRSNNRKLFRLVSVVVQLLISIGFAFCTIIILKQMYFLHHSADLGFSFQNRGAIMSLNSNQGGTLSNHLKQIPEVTEIVDTEGGMPNLVPMMKRMSMNMEAWEDKPANAENFDFERVVISPEYYAFYDFQLVAGEALTDTDSDGTLLLNESAAKAFGWDEPVGKHLFDGFYTVKGVIKDVYNFAPIVQAKPIIYFKRPQNNRLWVTGGTTVLFKYREGTWKSCKGKIEQMLKNEFADSDIRMFNNEEEYDKFLQSEKSLIKLLAFVAAICLFICVFGFVSMVSLTCEERRKEIAIRKINGAMTGDILSIFIKEYSLLLIIGSAIAFSTGYYMMQRWLENYVKQTGIPAWVYLSILVVMAFVIVLCVGWQVYRTSVENPAEIVKSV